MEAHKLTGEYDLRQLTMMRGLIKGYEADKISVKKLINDLEALLNVIENVEEDWKQRFLKEWGVLEDLYADQLYEKLDEVPESDKLEIKLALENIKKLINEKIV